MKASETIRQNSPWIPAEIRETDNIPPGDMPGEKVKIGPQQIEKARTIFPKLLELLMHALESNPHQRAVVVVCGGSGVGKTGIASVISYYLNRLGVGSYLLSGDNYPHRIPKYNDAERLHVFRKSGIDGLIAHGQYLEGRPAILKELQGSGNDSNPQFVTRYPWLAIYQGAGWNRLKNYLGTPEEIDFKELTGIISQFKNGESRIFLKRMGREETELWYDPVDFSDKNVLIIEWTHGNSHHLQGVDIPILLNSTPQETLAYRKSRNRDGATDSPFTTMVLAIEQESLTSQAPKARIILSKNGEILTYRDFVKRMIQEQV
jgi:hypothetical protein